MLRNYENAHFILCYYSAGMGRGRDSIIKESNNKQKMSDGIDL